MSYTSPLTGLEVDERRRATNIPSLTGLSDGFFENTTRENMRPDRLMFSLRTALAFAAVILGAHVVSAQTASPAAGACKVNTPQGAAPAPAAPDATTGIRIVATGPDGKPLQRKRFYLLQRSARSGGAAFSAAPKRADFLQGASPQLREWLARHDCDSLYCPEYESEYAEAVKNVPEFKRAYEEGVRKYRNDKLALEWVTVNFPLKNVRTEYYKRTKAWLEQAARGAGKVASVMTDEKGAAYFTGVRPGAYYVSNLIPLEEGDLLWDCQVTAPPPLPKQIHSVLVELSAPKKQAAGAGN